MEGASAVTRRVWGLPFAQAARRSGEGREQTLQLAPAAPQQHQEQFVFRADAVTLAERRPVAGQIARPRRIAHEGRLQPVGLEILSVEWVGRQQVIHMARQDFRPAAARGEDLRADIFDALYVRRARLQLPGQAQHEAPGIDQHRGVGAELRRGLRRLLGALMDQPDDPHPVQQAEHR